MLIKLRDENFRNFYLNTDLIVRVTSPLYRGGSVIYLTTGSYVECIEEPETVQEMVNELTEQKPKTPAE